MKKRFFTVITFLLISFYFSCVSYAQKKEEDKVEFKNDKGNPSNGFAQGRHQVYYQGTLYGHWEPAKVENKVMSIEFDEKKYDRDSNNKEDDLPDGFQGYLYNNSGVIIADLHLENSQWRCMIKEPYSVKYFKGGKLYKAVKGLIDAGIYKP